MEEKEVKMYEVKVKDGDKESEVTLDVDGTVVEVTTTEDINALPAAVAKALKSQGAEVSEAEKSVEHAQLKLIKLDTPITTFEAKIDRDGEKIEIKVAVDGTILKQHEAEEKKCNKDKDDDDEGAEHERDKD
jgi:hypothetical protein